MKILVTGGAGFIGNHLVKRLITEGHNVIVLDNFKRGNKLDKSVLKDIELIDGDVRNEEVVQKCAKGCEIIYHFAAVLGVDIVADNPIETMETEAFGIINISRAAILNRCDKIIYASTSGVYGKSAIEKAVEEEFSVSPSSSYSIAKRHNEIYLASLFQEKNVPSISLRFFNVYGPKQDERMVIPRFFEQAEQNKPITVFGSGEQTRDFTYIDDVIEACIRVIKINSGVEILNVSNNNEYSIFELAKIIKNLKNSSSEIKLLTPPSDRYDFEVQRRFGSSEKLYKLTGFKPDTDILEGLKKIIEYSEKK